jgi:hypothetical protein
MLSPEHDAHRAMLSPEHDAHRAMRRFSQQSPANWKVSQYHFALTDWTTQ